MNRARGLGAVLALLVTAVAARAQVVVINSPPPFVGGVVAASGFGVAVGGRHHHLSFSLSGYSAEYAAYGYGGFGFAPVAPYPFGRSVTIVEVYSPPPVVVLPPPFALDDDLPPGLRKKAARAAPQPLAVVINNDDIPDHGRKEAKNPPPVPFPPPKQEAVKPPPAPLPPPAPAGDPEAEYARQVALGREAFAMGAYGRAAHRFRLAVDALPASGEGHFLLAQALLVLAKYDDAFDAITQGLKRRPDWPRSGFRPVGLFGDLVADYADEMDRLDALLEWHPNDPVLVFLRGYQLWFDGRQDEARAWFRRAAQLLPDPAPAERFLQGEPTPRVVV
jgi:tetratricopeptide (TPR) repeat protein